MSICCCMRGFITNAVAQYPLCISICLLFSSLHLSCRNFSPNASSFQDTRIHLNIHGFICSRKPSEPITLRRMESLKQMSYASGPHHYLAHEKSPSSSFRCSPQASSFVSLDSSKSFSTAICSNTDALLVPPFADLISTLLS